MSQPQPIHVKVESSYRVDIRAKNHILVADEPVESGGTDEGPSPGDYLLSSLGACTAITLRMYANRKKWLVKEVNVFLQLSKTKDGDLITRRIEIEGELDNAQKERMKFIADKCPIHKMLQGSLTIDTELL